MKASPTCANYHPAPPVNSNLCSCQLATCPAKSACLRIKQSRVLLTATGAGHIVGAIALLYCAMCSEVQAQDNVQSHFARSRKDGQKLRRA